MRIAIVGSGTGGAASALLAWGRDLLFGPAAQIPFARVQFAQILLGEQTSPFTRWGPTKQGGPLAATAAPEPVRYRSAT